MATELSKSENCLNFKQKPIEYVDRDDDMTPPPVPPLPVNYQRSDGLYHIYCGFSIKDFSLEILFHR